MCFKSCTQFPSSSRSLIYVPIHIHTHTHTHSHTYTVTHTQSHTHSHTHTHTHTHTHPRAESIRTHKYNKHTLTQQAYLTATHTHTHRHTYRQTHIPLSLHLVLGHPLGPVGRQSLAVTDLIPLDHLHLDHGGGGHALDGLHRL